MSVSFSSLGVEDDLIKVLARRGIKIPTPIQAATLPDSLSGRDVLGRGRTGSGKTYGFLLPLVSRLRESGKQALPYRPRALILAPTRELVSQIEESLIPLQEAAKLTSCTIFGGVGQRPQVQALKHGVDIVVACPGRLEDLIQQNFCSLDHIEISILDEADYMADLGFLPGVRRLLRATPAEGQRLLFSATLDGAINVVVKEFLKNPVTHHADSGTAPTSTMTHHVLELRKEDRVPVLVDLLGAAGQTIVFTRTKYGAKKLAKVLNKEGVPSVELHGNLSQGARERNLAAFHSHRATTLVATDIAARGIHVDGISLVIHADPPVEHKAYVHRSGRTARAGSEGTVITLAFDEQLDDVRKLMKKAGISASAVRVTPGAAVLQKIVPGERKYGKGLKPGELLDDGASPSSRNQRSGQGRKPQHGGKSGGGRSSQRGQSGRSQKNSQERRRNEQDGWQSKERSSGNRVGRRSVRGSGIDVPASPPRAGRARRNNTSGVQRAGSPRVGR